MADSPQLPLTVDTAKKNLRDAAEAMSMSGYVRKHPYQTLGLAFFTGVILADNERAQALILGSELLRYLNQK